MNKHTARPANAMSFLGGHSYPAAWGKTDRFVAPGSPENPSKPHGDEIFMTNPDRNPVSFGGSGR
jgi:hypothetical protein